MSIKPKRLINPYEERMLEFIQTCIDKTYKIHTQVSLSQFCEIDSHLENELRKFFFSSSVDALITDFDYKPCLVLEFQSSYHTYPEAKERDRKKAMLLELAGVSLLYTRIKDFGILHLYSKNEEVFFNLFTGEGRENAKGLIQKYCQKSVGCNLLVAAW